MYCSFIFENIRIEFTFKYVRILFISFQKKKSYLRRIFKFHVEKNNEQLNNIVSIWYLTIWKTLNNIKQ